MRSAVPTASASNWRCPTSRKWASPISSAPPSPAARPRRSARGSPVRTGLVDRRAGHEPRADVEDRAARRRNGQAGVAVGHEEPCARVLRARPAAGRTSRRAPSTASGTAAGSSAGAGAPGRGRRARSLGLRAPPPGVRRQRPAELLAVEVQAEDGVVLGRAVDRGDVPDVESAARRRPDGGGRRARRRDRAAASGWRAPTPAGSGTAGRAPAGGAAPSSPTSAGRR